MSCLANVEISGMTITTLVPMMATGAAEGPSEMLVDLVRETTVACSIRPGHAAALECQATLEDDMRPDDDHFLWHKGHLGFIAT